MRRRHGWRGTGGDWRIHHYTLAEYGQTAELAQRGGRAHGSGNASVTYGGSQRWDLGLGFDGMMRLFETGWRKGAESLETITSEALAAARSTLKDQTYTATDDPAQALEWDLAAYLSGEPEHYIECQDFRTGSMRIPDRALRVGVRFAFSVGTDGQDMQRAVSTGVGVALGVMAHGVPVVLDAVSCIKCTCSTSRSSIQTVRLLDANSVESYDMLAVACHPGFLRRAGFAVCETNADICSCVRGGDYGYPTTVESLPVATQRELGFDLVIEAGVNCDAAGVVKMINAAIEGMRA